MKFISIALSVIKIDGLKNFGLRKVGNSLFQAPEKSFFNKYAKNHLKKDLNYSKRDVTEIFEVIILLNFSKINEYAGLAFSVLHNF